MFIYNIGHGYKFKQITLPIDLWKVENHKNYTIHVKFPIYLITYYR